MFKLGIRHATDDSDHQSELLHWLNYMQSSQLYDLTFHLSLTLCIGS